MAGPCVVTGSAGESNGSSPGSSASAGSSPAGSQKPRTSSASSNSAASKSCCAVYEMRSRCRLAKAGNKGSGTSLCVAVGRGGDRPVLETPAICRQAEAPVQLKQIVFACLPCVAVLLKPIAREALAALSSEVVYAQRLDRVNPNMSSPPRCVFPFR